MEMNEINVWKKVLNEVLESEYVKNFVIDIMERIERGEKTIFGEKWGFGENCYYKSMRQLLEDAVYQAFDNDVEDECPTLLKWLYDRVQEKLEDEIIDEKHLKYYITTVCLERVVRIEVNYDELLEEAHEYVRAELDKLPDKEIKYYIEKVWSVRENRKV